MKIRLLMFSLTILFLSTALFAARGFGQWGTATGTNTQISFPFYPTEIELCNDDTGTEELFYDVTDGVATTASGSTNIKVKAGECHHKEFEIRPSTSLKVGVISDGSSVSYRVEGTK